MSSLVTFAADELWETWGDPVRGRLRWTLLTDGADPFPGMVTTGVMTLEADGWLGRHRHTAPELYYVLDGEAAVTLDGDEVRVGVGSVVRLPSDVEHGVRAVDGPVRILFVFPTSGFADVVYRFDEDEAA